MSDLTDFTQWDYSTIFHSSPSGFLTQQYFGEGIHTVNLGISHLDILFKKQNCRRLLVVFGGAVARDLTNPPYFSGRGLTNFLPVNLLSFSDPAFTIDNDIRIGWYTGTSSEQVQNLIPVIIDKFAYQLRVKEVILLGGSAGGFAVLQTLPRLTHRSVGIVMNPQVDILKYHHKTSVETWKQMFNFTSSTQIKDSLSDATPLYSSSLTGKRLVYLQNSSDAHRKIHAIPFWSSSSIPIEIIEGNWGNGHVPPPKSLIMACLIAELLPVSLPGEVKSKLLRFAERGLNRKSRDET